VDFKLKEIIKKFKVLFISNKIIISGLILSFFYLILESTIHVYIFKIGNSIVQELFTTDLHELFMRLVVVFLIMFISILSQNLINNQKKTEQKLKESEKWYSITLKSIGDAVIATDLNGNIKFLNEVAGKLTGWKFSEAFGKPINDIFKIINERTHKPVENPVIKVINEGIIVGLANYSLLINRYGKEIPIDDSSAPIKDEEGNLFGVILVFRDITERKKVEEAANEVEKLRQEKLVMLGQLAGGVGHELRNPLGSIKNATYFLKMALEDPEPEVKESLEILEKEVNISETIINSLLGFARPKPPLFQKLNINSVIHNSISRIKIPDNVEILEELNESLEPFLGDPDQLAHILNNLILNATQAMPNGGRVCIKTESPRSGYINISISDTGIGIKKEDIEKIFKPLYTTKAKGIGLGLAISKIMIENHSGKIYVQSNVGTGSTFTIELPIRGKEVELRYQTP